MQASSIDIVWNGRASRMRRRRLVIGSLLTLVVLLFALTLMLGQTFTPPGEVLRVLFGEEVQGASFTVGQLRLPRAVLAVLTGLSFGLGGRVPDHASQSSRQS